MTSLLTPPPVAPPTVRTLADFWDRLGRVPLERILIHPAPGTATVADLIALKAQGRMLPELVDGTLVEKAMGLRESVLASIIARLIGNFVVARDLGHVSGEQGTMRLLPNLVRIPDVAFISWGRFPGGVLPETPIPDVVPDLAIEVLSDSNTIGEMLRKRHDYFSAGVRLVWEVDVRSQTVAVFNEPDQGVVLDVSHTLLGDPVLPDFSIRVADLFAELDRRPKDPPHAASPR